MSAAPYRDLGFRYDVPLDQWPAVENAAMVFVVADRSRPAARRLMRQFIGRSGLKRVLTRLCGRWIVLTCGRAGISATDARDVAELLDVHADILRLSRIVAGHCEVFHGLDAQTRTAVIENGREQALRMAPIAGRA